MGANRKLQQEIDRTLKKVQEGIEIFDQIWDKVKYCLRASRNLPHRSEEALSNGVQGMVSQTGRRTDAPRVHGSKILILITKRLFLVFRSTTQTVELRRRSTRPI